MGMGVKLCEFFEWLRLSLVEWMGLECPCAVPRYLDPSLPSLLGALVLAWLLGAMIYNSMIEGAQRPCLLACVSAQC